MIKNIKVAERNGIIELKIAASIYYYILLIALSLFTFFLTESFLIPASWQNIVSKLPLFFIYFILCYSIFKISSFGTLSVNKVRSIISWKYGPANSTSGEVRIDDYENFTFSELSGLFGRTYRLGLIKDGKTIYITPEFLCREEKFHSILDRLEDAI